MPSSSPIVFFVGSYTQAEGHVPEGDGAGIYCFSLDRKTGELTLQYKTKKTVGQDLHNPSYLQYDKARQELYVVEEICSGKDLSKVTPRLLVYTVQNADKEVSQLMITSEVDVPRIANCYVMHHDNQLWVASYGSGCVLQYPILPKEEQVQQNGADKAHSNTAQLFTTDVEQYSYKGHGPNIERQDMSHAHHVAMSPDKRWVYVCDLGSDAIWCHDRRKPLSSADPLKISTPSGSGPRHLVFHPTLPKVYVVAELTGHLLMYQYHHKTGELEMKQDISTYPADFDGEPSGAGIRMHASGKAVYVGNRNHNSIAVVALDTTGRVILDASGTSGSTSAKGDAGKSRIPRIQWVSCEGACPRDFAIDPSGQWLVVGNQDSDTLAILKITTPTHVDEDSVEVYECKTPSCIAFAN